MPQTAEQIVREIIAEIGYVPQFMQIAANDANTLRQLWRQSQVGFYRNALPEAFKCKLMLLSARPHRVRYCVPLMTACLLELGMPISQINGLLKEQVPSRRHVLQGLGSIPSARAPSMGWAAMPHDLETSVLWAAIRMMLRKDEACRDQLRAVLGEADYNRLSLLNAHCLHIRAWIENHPELEGAEDPCVKKWRPILAGNAPEILSLWQSISKDVRRKHISRRERKLVAEIARQDRIREELKLSEKRFRQVVNNAPFPVMIYAQDGQVVTINRAWEELSGYARERVPTVQAWSELAEVEPVDWSPQDVEALDGWDQPIEEGERRILTNDGQVRHWEFTTASLGKLADGRQAVMRFAADVTHRKELETQLWQTNRQMKGILDSIADGFVALDGETRFLFCSRNAEQILHLNGENALGKRFNEVFPDPQDAPLHQAIRRCLREQKPQHLEHFSARMNTTYDVHLYPSAGGLSAYIRDTGQRTR